MGASEWHYLTPYLGSPQRSLDALHRAEFAAHWAGQEYDTLEELWADEEFMDEQGTHSILDVPYAVEDSSEPLGFEDVGSVRPLPAQSLLDYFGTERPTVEQFTRVLADSPYLRTEVDLRWTGKYVVLHTDGEPTHFGVFGFSGD
ncbi:hypothetical protein [Kitasatospora sp. CB02891]|uniref:hypothetical protein n=1 Tax=Kitasatospora sp. CB02891 TaxID=2020329 RepID=UPI000C27BB26|nr:hypothetical protein [Kitasatospora sp. CB02891]PJN29910.1 hypothetical protein CG736_05230 [Kitasatospora sp. CB02891]